MVIRLSAGSYTPEEGIKRKRYEVKVRRPDEREAPDISPLDVRDEDGTPLEVAEVLDRVIKKAEEIELETERLTAIVTMRKFALFMSGTLIIIGFMILITGIMLQTGGIPRESLIDWIGIFMGLILASGVLNMVAGFMLLLK